MFLNDLLNINELNWCIAHKYVTVNNLAGSNLFILKYSKRAQAEGFWTDVTKACRGLIIASESDSIIDDNAVIVERPFKKFFTIDQLKDEWGATKEVKLIDGDESDANSCIIVNKNEDIDTDLIVNVYDKVDGCLLIMYSCNNKLALTTCGSFTSDEAVLFNKLFYSKYYSDALYKKLSFFMNEYTFLFEGLSRDLHVLSYTPSIRFLGVVRKSDGYYFTPNNTILPIELGKAYFDNIECLGSMSIQDAISLPERSNAEGIVLSSTTHPQVMYKYKYKGFLDAQYIKHHLNKKTLIQLLQEPISSGKVSTVNGAVSYIKEYWYDSIDKYYDDVCALLTDIFTDYYNLISKSKHSLDSLIKYKQDDKSFKKLLWEKYGGTDFFPVLAKMNSGGNYKNIAIKLIANRVKKV